jgi:flagellar biosynthetic protein FliR
MSQATLSHVIKALGGADEITAFFVVLARVGPLFVLAPLFSSKMVPPRVRGILAVGITIGLTPMAFHGQHVPGDPMSVAGLMIENALVGVGFAFAMACVMAAIDAAGHLVDFSSGFSYGASVDPINGNQGGTMSQLYGLIGTAVFVAIGGDAWVLRGLAGTFRVVPLTHGPQIGPLASGAVDAFSGIFVSALEVAAPVLLALLVTDVAFGMVSRVVPQLNIFGVGFPVKVGVALLVAGASLPFIGNWLSDQLATSVGSALTTLHIA